MSDTKPIKIVIVDDHDLLREGIRARLADQTDITIIGEGSDGNDAVRLCKTLSPDVILLDISMPDKNGMEAAIEIRACTPATKILFISVFDDNEYVQEALRIGANGFVLKDVCKPEMLNAIRTVAKGATYLSANVTSQVNREPVSVFAPRKDYGLTCREEEVLSKIAKGLANKQIAYDLSISVRTVESHRSTIREKTGGGNAAALALIAAEMGLN